MGPGEEKYTRKATNSNKGDNNTSATDEIDTSTTLLMRFCHAGAGALCVAESTDVTVFDFLQDLVSHIHRPVAVEA